MTLLIAPDKKSFTTAKGKWTAKQTSIAQVEIIGRLLIVREDYYKYTGSNIYALEENLTEVWTAELPHDSDSFVGLAIEGTCLSCHTWNGFKYKIDASTGKIVDKLFTK